MSMSKNINMQKKDVPETLSKSRSEAVVKPRILLIRNNPSNVCVECQSEEDYPKLHFQDDENVPAEYWHVQKLFKYLKIGDQSATTVSLACLDDLDFKDPWVLMAFRDIGGIEVLVNLLETNHYTSVLMAFKLLSKVARHPEIQLAIIESGAIPTLVHFLRSSDRDLQAVSAYMINKLTRFSKGLHEFYYSGGLPDLISMLDVPAKIIYTPPEELNNEEKGLLKAVATSSKALFQLTSCNKVKMDLYSLGIIKIISKLLKAKSTDVVRFTMGILQNCATLIVYQKAIETEDIIESTLSNLESTDMKSKELCLRAIFRSCDGSIPRWKVYELKGTNKLADILDNNPDKTLTSSLTGAIWKCSILDENVLEFNKRNVIPKLAVILNQEDQDEEVLVNTAGALAEMARFPENKQAIKRAGTITTAVKYLGYTSPQLLENVAKLLGECAWDRDCMTDIESFDGVRLIWSLLKNKSDTVKASACLALVPCIRNATDSGELVRSLIGALELVIKLLYSDNEYLLGTVCAAIAEIATDSENLAVITEHGVVELLAKLCHRKNEFMSMHLASAIGGCCAHRHNCYQFGQLDVAGPLVRNLLNATTEEAKTETVTALCALSRDPFNCIVMHRNGVVPLLLDAVQPENRRLQEAAAGCLYNLRKLALCADEAKYLI